MAVDVSKIPNNNKFDPVREAILQLQEDIQAEGQIAYDGEITVSKSTGSTITITGGSFSVNQSNNTNIIIGIDDSGYYSTSGGEIDGNVDITGNLVVEGNLTVSGATITKLSEEVLIEDNIIVLNSNEDGTPTLNSGIEIERGTSPNVDFLWNETSNEWDLQTYSGARIYRYGVGSTTLTIEAGSTAGDAVLALTPNTTGTGGVIMTTNERPIAFQPNSTTKMVIASGGDVNIYDNLAIGKTGSPSYALDVTGDGYFTEDVTATTFIGDLTGNVTGDLTGNADTATTWQTARTITIGDTGKSVDGSADVTWTKTEIGITKANIDALDINSDQLDGLHATDFNLQYVTDNGASTTNRIVLNTGENGGFRMGDAILRSVGTNASQKDFIVNAKAMRIGAHDASWNYDEWAGIAYVHSSKTLYIGGARADGTIWANNAGDTDDSYVNFIGLVNNGLQVNGNTVWHAGNDGSSSGLNADQVDGIEGSQFLRSDVNDVKQGYILFDSEGTATINGNFNSSPLIFRTSGWDTNNSVARDVDWYIRAESTSSIYPEGDLVFYEESPTHGHYKMILRGRGSGSSYLDVVAADFYGNVNINQTVDSTGGNLDVVGNIQIGGTTVIDSSRNLTAVAGTFSSNLQVDDKITITGTTNNLLIDETADGTWHLYDTFQDNGIIIHSSSGGMEFQYNGVTEMTIDGGGVSFTGTVDLSDANLNIGSADIVFGIDATDTGARGLVWNFDADGVTPASNIGYIRAGGTLVGEVLQFNMNAEGTVTGSDSIYEFKNGGTDVVTIGADGSLNADSFVGGSFDINTSQGSNSTDAYTAYDKIVFDNAFSDQARGANKIVLYDNNWLGGLGIHDATVAYYSGETHKWYQSNGTDFNLKMSLDDTGTLQVANELIVDDGAIKSDNNIRALTSANAAQKGRFGGIQVSTSYSGTPPDNGILFHLDTNLYRNAANELRTNDSFIVDGSFTSGNINSGTIYINGGASAWSDTTQGKTTGSIHIDPATGTDFTGGAITFGASDASAGTNAQAGIYITSDGTYGTKMYLSTTDSYATGSKSAIEIDHSGKVNFIRTTPTIQGNTIATYAGLSVNTNAALGGGQLLYVAATGTFEFAPADLTGFATTSQLSGYLPTSGGTLTGLLTTTDVNVFGDLSVTGSLQVGSGFSSAYEYNFAKSQNTGTIMMVENPNNGTSAYSEFIVRNAGATNDIRIGSSANYTDAQWQGGWVFATQDLLLKSNNNVEVFAGGSADSNIVATFGSSDTVFRGNVGINQTTSPASTCPLEVTSHTTGTSTIQQWSYQSAPSSYRLQLNQYVTSSNVRYSFDQLNAGASYDNILVLHKGSVGINNQDPLAKLDIHMSDSNGQYGRGKDGNLNIENTNTANTEGGWMSISGYMGNTTSQYQMGAITGGKTSAAGNNDYGGYLSFWTTSSGSNGEANSGQYERMRIDDLGNAVIGNTSVNFKQTNRKVLELNGNSEALFAMSNGGSWQYYIHALASGIYHATGNKNLLLEVGSANVGIGTTSPSYKLEVNGTAYIGDTFYTNSTSYLGGLVRLNGTTSSNSQLDLPPTYGALRWYDGTTFRGGIGTSSWSTVGGANDLTLYLVDGNFHISNTNTSIITTFDRANGRVGIGTTTPSVKLEVAPSTNATTIKTGGLEMQSYAVNNAWYAENVYFNGASWIVRETGYATQMYMGAGTINFVRFPYVAGGTATSPISTMYLNAGGNVGIGTTSPATKLDVNGAGTFVGNIALITDATSGNYSLIQHKYDGVAKAYSGYNSGFALYGGETDVATRIQSGGQYAITALTNGNVGIGTTSPSGKFEIKSAATTYTSAPAITFTDNAGVADSRWIVGNIATNYGSFNIAQADSASSTNYTPRITILSGGNVGIGTASPQAPLHVIAASSSDNALIQEWSYTSTLRDTYSLMLKQTVTSGVVRYNFSMVNNSTAYDNVLVLDRGKVGINTVNPNYAFHVDAGTIQPTQYLILGEDAYSSSSAYVGLKTTLMSGANDYMILSGKTDGNTFISAKDGNYVAIRGGGNNSGNQILVNDGSTIDCTTSQFRVSGDVIAYYSDMRLKTKIGDIENPIEKVKALSGFYYEPNEVAQSYGYEVERRIGLSAQDVKEVVPEAVSDAPIGDGYMSVDYAKLVPVLVEAIKEQQKQIDELKARLDGSTK